MTSRPINQLFSLEGRLAVVTGASRGIGRGLAEALASAGAKVIGLARSPSPQFDGDITYQQLDLTGDVSAVGANIHACHGNIDILVNAAGVSLAPSAQMPELARFDQTLNVNLRAAYAMSLSVAPYMPTGGSIINVTSIGGQIGFPDNPGYVASKGGLRQLTRALAVDLGERGIRVNALAPGYIHTDMTTASHADPERHARRARHTCLGRWGQVDELAGAAIFLASPASGYMTGQDLVIDGGWTAKGLV
jgi:gluconate 5-dehydrogenase